MSNFNKIDIKNITGSSIKISIGGRSISLQYANLIGVFAILVIVGFLLYKLNINDIKCIEIPNLDTKIESFNFNTSSNNDILALKFISQKCDFQVDFKIPSDRKVEFLKNAIVSHFELEKHFVFSKMPDDLTWEITSNHRILKNEKLSLKEAGILDNDVVRLNVIRKYIDPAVPVPKKDSTKEVTSKSFLILKVSNLDDTIFINPKKIRYHEDWSPFKSYYYQIHSDKFRGELEFGINRQEQVKNRLNNKCYIDCYYDFNRIIIRKPPYNGYPPYEYFYLRIDNRNEFYLPRIYKEIEDCEKDCTINNGIFKCNINFETMLNEEYDFRKIRNRNHAYLKEINIQLNLNSLSKYERRENEIK